MRRQSAIHKIWDEDKCWKDTTSYPQDLDEDKCLEDNASHLQDLDENKCRKDHRTFTRLGWR